HRVIMDRAPIRPPARTYPGRSGLARGILEIGLHLARILDRQLLALAVQRLAHGQAHPALGHAIFLDIGLFVAVEAHAHAALEHLSVVIGAVWIDREAVRRGVTHTIFVSDARPSVAAA